MSVNKRALALFFIAGGLLQTCVMWLLMQS